LEGSSSDIIEVLSWHLTGQKGEFKEKSFRAAGDQAENRTAHFLNTSLEVTVKLIKMFLTAVIIHPVF
jgi:hypothetical protein